MKLSEQIYQTGSIRELYGAEEVIAFEGGYHNLLLNFAKRAEELEADLEEARNYVRWLWGATKHTPWVEEEIDEALALDIKAVLVEWDKDGMSVAWNDGTTRI